MARIALIVGHSPKRPGAVNKTTGLTEWVFNRNLASALKLRLPDSRIFIRPEVHGLATVVEEVNAYNPDLAVSLHCNAFNTTSSGSEVLYWHSSQEGKRLATNLVNAIANALGLKNRGAKGIKKYERGWYILAKIKCVAVLLEPFFIDNNMDLQAAYSNFSKLVDAILAYIDQ